MYHEKDYNFDRLFFKGFMKALYSYVEKCAKREKTANFP